MPLEDALLDRAKKAHSIIKNLELETNDVELIAMLEEITSIIKALGELHEKRRGIDRGSSG